MYNMASTTYWDHGRFEEADRILRETYELSRQASDAYHAGVSSYNVACLAAIRDDRREALDWLHKALEAGYVGVARMNDDSDLASLHGDPEFEQLIAVARSRGVKPEPGH